MEFDYFDLLLTGVVVAAAAIFIGTYRLQQALTWSEWRRARLEWENYKQAVLLEMHQEAERLPEENIFPDPPDADGEAPSPLDYSDLPF